MTATGPYPTMHYGPDGSPRVDQPRGAAIDLGGRTRYLRYTMNAWEQLDEQGVSILDFDTFEGDNAAFARYFMKPKRLKAIVWAGLLHDEPTITVEAVGDMLEIGDAAEVLRVFFEAVGSQVEGKIPVNPPNPAGDA